MSEHVGRQFLTLVLGLWIVGCAENKFVAPPPPKVTVAHPVTTSLPEIVECTGVARVANSVEVRARVQGFISKAPVEQKEGQLVEEGELLFEIDPRPFVAEIESARASLRLAKAAVEAANSTVEQAKAKAANAQAQYVRSEQAARDGAVTAAELDDMRTSRDLANTDILVAQASVKSADAEVAVAQAALDKAELDHEYTQVTAPIAGRVGESLIDIGTLVGSGEPTLLAEIVSYDPIYVYFTVSEADFQRHLEEAAARGESGPEIINSKPERQVNVGLIGEAGHPHQGKLDFADLKIDSDTGTYLLRAVFENQSWIIRPGAFVRVEIPLEEQDVVLIDDACVVRDNAGAYVIVVNNEDVAERRRVTLGRAIEGQRVIATGLTSEDRVVVNGIQRARPGTKVVVGEVATSAPATDDQATSEAAP